MAAAVGPLGFLVDAMNMGFIGVLLVVPIGNLLAGLSVGGELKEIVADIRERQRLFASNQITVEGHV